MLFMFCCVVVSCFGEDALRLNLVSAVFSVAGVAKLARLLPYSEPRVRGLEF